METPLNRDDQVQDVRRMYDYFVDAEEFAVELTYEKIQQELLPYRNIKTVRVYVQRRWSWFLRPVDVKERTHRYICKGIREYPYDCFELAHRPKRMQYFREFAESIEAYEKRRIERKQTKDARDKESGRVLPGEVPLSPLVPVDTEQPAPANLPVIILADEDEDDVPIEDGVVNPDEPEPSTLTDKQEQEVVLTTRMGPIATSDSVHVGPPDSSPVEQEDGVPGQPRDKQEAGGDETEGAEGREEGTTIVDLPEDDPPPIVDPKEKQPNLLVPIIISAAVIVAVVVVTVLVVTKRWRLW